VSALVVRAEARWPESTQDPPPPSPAGFVFSTFSPLVAAVAERCLNRARPAGARTAIVIASPLGDLDSAVHVADAVDHRTRVGPLLFYQSVPNAVAGYVAARWGLTGPVVCTSPVADPLADGLATADLLFDDGDCDEALVMVVTDTAHALLIRPAPQEATI
jgi:3-oxoacyl-(acyl-carrier-protein) synthase